VTQQIVDKGTRHAETKNTELDQFAGRLSDDHNAEVIQQTLAANSHNDEHTGNYLLS